MTAMQMQPSATLSLIGIFRQLQVKHSNPLSLQTFIKPSLESQPTSNLVPWFVKYFPFPQPTSTTIEPTSKELTNLTTFGQGLCLVSLKCEAILL